MKKIFVIALAAMMTAMSANAQFYDPNKNKEKTAAEFNPDLFVNLQGGIQLPNTPGMGKLVSPVFSLNVGRNIAPIASARLGIEGCNSRVFNEYTGKKRTFKFFTTSADAMLNLTNCFSCTSCPVNFFLI
jgi:hypothetical protein